MLFLHYVLCHPFHQRANLLWVLHVNTFRKPALKIRNDPLMHFAPEPQDQFSLLFAQPRAVTDRGGVFPRNFVFRYSPKRLFLNDLPYPATIHRFLSRCPMLFLLLRRCPPNEHAQPSPPCHAMHYNIA